MLSTMPAFRAALFRAQTTTSMATASSLLSGSCVLGNTDMLFMSAGPRSSSRQLASASASASAVKEGDGGAGRDSIVAEARKSEESYRKELKKLRKEYHRTSVKEQEERRREREAARSLSNRRSSSGAGVEEDADRQKVLEAAVKRAKAAREEARSIARQLYSVDPETRDAMRAQKAINAREVQEKTDALKRLALRSLNEESKTWITDEPTLRAKIREAMERVVPMER